MSIFELLSPQSIFLHLEALTSEEVIRTMGEGLRSQGAVNNGFVQATLERESTAPTGLVLSGTHNAAIPHADVEYVQRSSIALATLETPVPFRNMVDKDEEVPVQLVVMLALADPRSQIEALEQVATLLQDPEVVEQLIEAVAVDQILKALRKTGT